MSSQHARRSPLISSILGKTASVAPSYRLARLLAICRIKARMGATHFLMKTLPRVASEMALHVLAYNLTRVMNIMGIQPLMAVMRA